MIVQTRYKYLRDEFVKIAKPLLNLKALEEIKIKHCDDISSKRKLSSIKDLEKLIYVLEKYAFLSYDNIKILHYIENKYINVLRLQVILKDYEDWFKKLKIPDRFNMYLDDDVQPTTSNNDQKTCDRTRWANSLEGCACCGSQSNSISQQLENKCKVACETKENYTNKENVRYDKESKLKQTVVLKASELLGRSWRDVCRYMDLKESQIDEIQAVHPYNLKEQCFQALQICISQSDSQWKINILRALEKGRRKDIKEVIEKILLCDGT